MRKGNVSFLSADMTSKTPKTSGVEKEKHSIQRQQPDALIRKGLAEFLPTSVQKTYFMLSDAERDVLNSALEKYRPGQSEPILVGGNKVFKPALRLPIKAFGGQNGV